MLNKINYIYIIVLILSLPQTGISQTCGFGCLGLSGIYAGYSFENYTADGLNQQLNDGLLGMEINDQKYKFHSGQGFRFGMNIVRANFESYFFSVKGYYQFLKEEQVVTAVILPQEEFDFKSKFEMNHWALGFDFGIPVVSFMDWKIIDASIKFFNTQLINQVITNSKVIEETNFSIPKITVGYAVGSGIIIHIIKDYLSIEGTGMYNFTNIEYLTNDKDSERYPENNSNVKLITNGGFSAIVQLNVGVPF